MIEASEDVSLVVEQRLREVAESQRKAKAVRSGEIPHPRLADQNAAAPAETAPADYATLAIREEPAAPADSSAAYRHFRLGAVAALALILLLLWIRERARR